ncbi:plasmid replication protein RepC [Pseudoroseomonas globiformis]|uniref:Plasmid replication protein RepC n=1 Tax=Teichococcus globiformis TaxID=2307229 RepID=A0ABV7G8K3_9PROT
MERPAFPPAGRCGLRKLTPNHLIAARLAEQAQGLPPGVRHPVQLLAALRRAAPFLGQRGLLPLMEALFRWTQPQDWEPDATPLVWPSNDTLAATLGCSERHVSRLIAAAVEARLIAVRDATDRRRRGLRRDGRIQWATGLDLRPMAALYTRFLDIAEAGETARRRMRALRREASRGVQRLGQLRILAREQSMDDARFDGWMAQAHALAGAIRQAEDPDPVEPAAQVLQTLIDQATAALEQAVDNADMSGLADRNVVSKEATKTPKEPEGTLVAPVPLPPIAGSAQSQVTAVELAALAPRLAAYLPRRQSGWRETCDAAEALCRQLGISSSLYGEACGVLGRLKAAVAVGLISTKPDGYFRTGDPAAYLRGMLRRARSGQLHLGPSIHGLRQSAFRAEAQLTAVNRHGRDHDASTTPPRVRYCTPHAAEAVFASGTHG